MAEAGQAGVRREHAAPGPTIPADPFDSSALAARLEEARARRAEVLARRNAEAAVEPQEAAVQTGKPSLALAPIFAAPAVREAGQLVAAPEDALRRLRAPAGKSARRGWVLGALLIAGSFGIAVTVVQGSADLRQRLAVVIAPELGELARPTPPQPRGTGTGVRVPRPEASPSVPPVPEPVTSPPLLRGLPTRAAATLPPALPGLAPTLDAVLAGAPAMLAVPEAPASLQASGVPTAAGVPVPPTVGPAPPVPLGPEPGEMAALLPEVAGSASTASALPAGDARPLADTRPVFAAPGRLVSDGLPAAALAPPVSRLSVTDPAQGTGTLQVFVHHPPDAAARAATLAEGLRGAGLEAARVVSVAFPISRSNLRYYHPEDAAAAKAIALGLAPDLEARDFTDYRPSPPPGTIEIWLAGKGPAPDAPARSGPGPVVRVPAARSQDTEAEARARLQAQVERLLRGQIETLAR